MARKPVQPPRIVADPPTLPGTEPHRSRDQWPRGWVVAAVVGLLGVQYTLAAMSLLGENPTVDEIGHLPAGISYWQKGTFKLYHHNPPLTKLVAALPVVLANPVTAPLYELKAWTQESYATFGEFFAYFNQSRYLDLFTRARLVMPLFALVGGLAVFAWSRHLYGTAGGFLSLTLWVFCPNVLAHCRLVTSDVAAAAMVVCSTFLFVRYLDRPTWRRAVVVGGVLGLAELTKFSSILLYGFWPTVAALRLLSTRHEPEWKRRLSAMVGQGGLIVLVSVVVINLGYGFEGIGQPLGRFEFASRTLTVPRGVGQPFPRSDNQLLESSWRYRVNRFRGTVLANLPVPLPKHYVLGFDEQKLETEGIPRYFFNADLPHDDTDLAGYSVYLNGELKQSGWWYYYLATLAYKVPEGTWFLVVLGGLVLALNVRSRSAWLDEFAVLALPIGVLAAISFLTDICLGIRYILPIFPFLYVATGKVAPWATQLARTTRRWVSGAIGIALGGVVLSSATIHPHYLAYFNQLAGGPDRGSNHLIDSNLDWGQDLVTLGRWLRTNHPDVPVGLAYFGQINPSLLRLSNNPAGFRWFLPPVDGPCLPMGDAANRLIGPARELAPGLYAVSASLVRGLQWRFHDSLSLTAPELAWQIAWKSGPDAFGYFADLQPIARVGHSIFVYEVTAADSARWKVARRRPRLKE